MAEITEVFFVQVEHATGEFIAKVSAPNIDEAIDIVADWSAARGLDCEAYWPMDVTEIDGTTQLTDIDTEV